MLQTVHPVHALVMLQMCVGGGGGGGAISIYIRVYVFAYVHKFLQFRITTRLSQNTQAIGTCNVAVKNLSV